MLSDSFKEASQKIGATIGLEMAEEEGTLQAVGPPLVELADVHMNSKQAEAEKSAQKSAPKAKEEEMDL